MELRRLSICLAFFIVAFVAQCSESRHSIKRRGLEDINYDDAMADEPSDDEAQNDAEGNDQEDEVEDGVILSQSTNYSVPIGRTLRLECMTSSSSPVVLQWTRDNTRYFLGTLKTTEQELKTYNVDDRFVIGANSTDLIIKDVQPSDSGVYTCEILQTNKLSITHRVTVLESPRIINFSATDNGRMVEGSDLLLTCEVSGSPPPQIVWSKQGRDGGNVRLQEKDGEFAVNSVYMKNIQRDKSGKYYCYAFNNLGHSQAELEVIVRGKPHVHVHRTVVNSAINVEAILQCAAHEEPAPHIRWYKDGKRIEDSSRQYSVTTNGQHSNLTVTPTADQDFGTFTCEAENELGRHSKSIELVQSPVIENLDVDGPKLSWTIHSHQPLTHIEIQLRDIDGNGEWRTVSVPLPEDTKHEYEIVYTLEEENLQNGKYEATVKVKNEKSWSTHGDTALVDYVQTTQPEPIQHASVYGGNAHFIKPSSFALTTTIMYLLVRTI